MAHTLEAGRFEEVKQAVNTCLADYFKERIVAAEHEDIRYGQLWEALSDVALDGGKRLRPYMTVLAYEAFHDRNDEVIIPVASAIELLHASFLIHDDIIDRDTLRHGRPNVAGVYQEQYGSHISDPEERDHFAMSSALLAGNLALSAAYQLVIKSSLTPEQKLQAQRLLGAAIESAAGGELLDLEASFIRSNGPEPVKIAQLKTASYSFIMPLLMGATLAGADDGALESLRQLGDATGVAYQLVDDILGLFGDESVTGKPVDSDIAEGKATFLIQRARELAPSGTEQLDRLLGKQDITAEELNWARDFVRTSGALGATEQAVQAYLDHAQEMLNSISTANAESRSELAKVIALVGSRTY